MMPAFCFVIGTLLLPYLFYLHCHYCFTVQNRFRTFLNDNTCVTFVVFCNRIVIFNVTVICFRNVESMACNSNPCMHGGTCSNSHGGRNYTCSGYNGLGGRQRER